MYDVSRLKEISCINAGNGPNRTHILTNKFVFDNSSWDHYNYEIK